MFTRISYRIAAQFTALVFALMLVTGGIFLTADLANRGRMIRGRMERQLRPLLDNTATFGTLPQLPPFQRDRMRIVDAEGNVLFAGTLFENIPLRTDTRIATIENGGESYDILTNTVMRDGQLIGYIQVADRAPPNDLLERLLLFLLISGGISGLTFGAGLFFARRSLTPARQMMERLEQFTQDASHELRTPLTAVSTSLDMALMTDDNREYVKSAKNDLKDMTSLVERLLELARLDKFVLQTETVDLTTLINDAIDKHKPVADGKGVTIERSLAKSVDVSGDQTLLRQVIGNLLTNAVKFNKAGGKISVTLTPDMLTVTDTGKGISAGAMAHIFDRFYQEDASRTAPKEGLGLGLALVKRIVELHGWTIEAESDEGEGATFRIHLS